jgi:hypothetical protein
MKLEALDYKNIQSGLYREAAVSESRLPLDSVVDVINFDFDKIGAATLRKGTTILGNQISAGTNILGLYEFRDSGAGTNNQIVAVNGTVLYYLASGTWTSKRTSLTSGAKARFTTYLDYLFMVNGNEATASWTGAAADSFSTTTNVTNAPIGKFIDNFKARIWIAGNATYPDRLYYSSLPTSVTTPLLTWDTDVATGQWIDVSPSDGENITGLKRDKNSLLVFKNNHIYRVFSVSETDLDPKINLGTYSQESIVEAKDGIYFHHPSGFYKYSDGSAKEISLPIVDFIRNISLTNYSKVCGWEDGDHVLWSVGDVTISGITYTNVVCRYTISSQVWTIRSYPKQFLFSSKYNDGSNLYRLVGDNDGNILKVDIGNTDNGSSIQYMLTHRFYTFDGFKHTEKTLKKTLFSHDGGTGSKVLYRVDNDKPNDFTKSLGELGVKDSIFNDVVKGRKIQFRINGTSKGEPFTYNGFEPIDIESDIVEVKNG